jgi:flagellar hook-length control protein FliK
LPVPRVASEATAVQHHPLNSRRPPATEAKQPSSPFSALLDDTGGTTPPSPPSPHDRPERPQPSTSSAQSSSASTARNAKQPEQGGRRDDDKANDRVDDADAQQPAADAKSDETAATDAKADDATDQPADAKETAPADAADAAALAAALDASAPQAVVPAPAATATDAVVLAAAIDAPAVTQPNAGEPAATPATDPAAVLPAAAAAANEVAGAKGARIAAADALAGEAQGAADADAGNPTDDKAQTGRKGAIAAIAGDGVANAGKPRTVKSDASGADSAPSKADATEGQTPRPTGAQTGMQAEANPTGKSEPAHHAGRGVGQDAAQKAGETRLQADIQTPGAADRLPADASQLASLQHSADRFANLVPTAAQSGAAASDPTAVPLAGLAVEIAARAQAGSNRFEIRLDPPDLGRIDVRLDIDRDGHVTSRLMVEKAETLDLLRRDAPELERALQQAGLKTGDSGLQFALRDQSFGGQNQDDSSSPSAKLVVADPDMPPVETVPGVYGRALRLGAGIDIRV